MYGALAQRPQFILGTSPQFICSLVMFLAHNGKSQEQSIAMMDWAFVLICFCATRFQPDQGCIQLTELPFLSSKQDLSPQRLCYHLSLMSLTPIFSTPNTISSFPFYTLFLMELSLWQNLPHECGTHHFRGKGDSLDLQHCFCQSNRLSEVEPNFLTLRGLLSNLCLTLVRYSAVCPYSGLLVSSMEIVDLNIWSM